MELPLTKPGYNTTYKPGYGTEYTDNYHWDQYYKSQELYVQQMPFTHVQIQLHCVKFLVIYT